MEAARSMLHGKKVPLELWGEAIMCATHVLNRTITSNKDVTPFELWRGCKPDVSYFRIFGSPAFTHVPDELRRKLDPKAVECIFVGYCENSKSFRMWNPATRRIIISRDVIFKEETVNQEVSLEEAADYDSFFPLEKDSGFPPTGPVHDGEDLEATLPQQIEGAEEHHESQMEPDGVEETQTVETADNQEEAPALDIVDNQVEAPAQIIADNQEEAPALGTVDDQEEEPFYGWEETRRRSSRIHKQMEKVGLRSVEETLTEDGSWKEISTSQKLPKDYQEAISSEDAHNWKMAIKEEYSSLMENGTWELVQLPEGRAVIQNKWVFTIKPGYKTTPPRFKARLVAKGFTQEYGVDYEETFPLF